MAAAVVDLVRRLGEVPDARTDDRRAWLLGLTRADLLVIIREHGTIDNPFAHCWGWGSVGSGTEDGSPVRCSRCGHLQQPMWFLEDGTRIARCARCAAIDHLTECDMWP